MDPDHTPLAFFGGLGIFLLLIFLAVILSLSSLVFYIIHASQNPNLEQNNLLLIWILLFVFASGLGQLIYWIIEILNKRQQPLKM
jgi:glycerol-3-phosphate acyltransferase PlsY